MANRILKNIFSALTLFVSLVLLTTPNSSQSWRTQGATIASVFLFVALAASGKKEQ